MQIPMEGQPRKNSTVKGYQTPCWRNKDDLGRIDSRQNAKVSEKSRGERNKQHPFAGPSNEDAKE